MNKKSKYVLIVIGVLGIAFILGHIPIWIDDYAARKNKAKVRELISVGQDLSEAEGIIKNTGFRLMYDKPITPTYDKSYLQQIFIVGSTSINVFESFAYAAQLSWMPFTHNESPYLVINASLDGTITEIE
jgi:hypothetical protein